MASEITPLILRPYQRGTLPWDPGREKVAGILVLVALSLERLSYYALISNLFLYLNGGKHDVQSWTQENSLTAVYITAGISYICCPLGGVLSDAFVGRYWTILIGFALYLLGFSLLAALSKNALTFIGCDLKPSDPSDSLNRANCSLPCDDIDEFDKYTVPPCLIQVYVILAIIGFAVGIVKANLAPFGAEQIKYGGQRSTRKFFNYYYWCVNLGSLIGVGACSYVAQDIEGGFFWMFIANVVVLLAAAVVFASGRCFYLVHRPAGSAIGDVFGIIQEAICGKCFYRRNIPGSPLLRRRRERRLGPSCLDYAKIRYGGSYHEGAVDDVKQLGRIFLLFLALLPYWLVYFQVQTGFQAQGVHLKVALLKEASKEGFVVPTSWLTLFNQVFIIIMIPVMNGLLYPFLDSKGVRIPLVIRMAIGMAFSAVSVLCAGILQYFCLRLWNEGYRIQQVIGGTTYNATDLSILYQIPQYSFVGAAEVFSGVAGLEFAYSAAPRLLQGIVTGLYWAMEGFGSFLGSALVMALSEVWSPNDPDYFSGRLDYYFYLLTAIQVVTCAAFSAWITFEICKGRRRFGVGGESGAGGGGSSDTTSTASDTAGSESTISTVTSRSADRRDN